jgi:hypothetical protein
MTYLEYNQSLVHLRDYVPEKEIPWLARSRPYGKSGVGGTATTVNTPPKPKCIHSSSRRIWRENTLQANAGIVLPLHHDSFIQINQSSSIILSSQTIEIFTQRWENLKSEILLTSAFQYLAGFIEPSNWDKGCRMCKGCNKASESPQCSCNHHLSVAT